MLALEEETRDREREKRVIYRSGFNPRSYHATLPGFRDQLPVSLPQSYERLIRWTGREEKRRRACFGLTYYDDATMEGGQSSISGRQYRKGSWR